MVEHDARWSTFTLPAGTQLVTIPRPHLVSTIKLPLARPSARTTGNTNQVFNNLRPQRREPPRLRRNRNTQRAGRFTQVDPCKWVGEHFRSAVAHFYSYKENAPTDFVDPYGLIWIFDFGSCHLKSDGSQEGFGIYRQRSLGLQQIDYDLLSGLIGTRGRSTESAPTGCPPFISLRASARDGKGEAVKRLRRYAAAANKEITPFGSNRYRPHGDDHQVIATSSLISG